MTYPQYATDWHQCTRCGCTFPDRELKKLQLVDDVLQLSSDVYVCLSAERCARYEGYRKEQLARDVGLSPKVPIGKRRGA